MLSEGKFEKAMKLLEDNFNKKLSDPVVKIWRGHLNENLTDAELTEGVRLAIIECQFMPTPKQLTDLGKRDGENRQAYQVFKALPSSEMKMSDEERLENLRQLNQMWTGGTKEIPGNSKHLKAEKEDYQQTAAHLIKQWKEQGLID